MSRNKWKNNIGVFLYDRQKGGKFIAAFKKSFAEVSKTLQGERTKKK